MVVYMQYIALPGRNRQCSGATLGIPHTNELAFLLVKKFSR